jgi:hypothetical protein
MADDRLLTTGEIAVELKLPLHKVLYIIGSRGIEPTTRVGRFRAFDAKAVRQVAAAAADVQTRKRVGALTG